MSWSNFTSHLQVNATIAQTAKKTKKGTTIALSDDAWSRIVPYVDSKTLCANKKTRDAAVFRDVADGSSSLMPTTERHFIEFAKKDIYNAYFQDLFASFCRSRVSPHLKLEGWFAKLGDVSTLKGKVPTGVKAQHGQGR